VLWRQSSELMTDLLLEDKCQEKEGSPGTMETFMKEISDSTKCTEMEQWDLKTVNLTLEFGKMESMPESIND